MGIPQSIYRRNSLPRPTKQSRKQIKLSKARKGLLFQPTYCLSVSPPRAEVNVLRGEQKSSGAKRSPCTLVPFRTIQTAPSYTPIEQLPTYV